MKRELAAGLYFLIYVGIPTVALHYITQKYPGLISNNAITITMLFLLTLFLSATVALYIRYTSIPTAISIIAAIIYLNILYSSMSFTVIGANISLKMQNLLLIIYALLTVKIILAIYSDLKQKHLSLSTTTQS